MTLCVYRVFLPSFSVKVFPYEYQRALRQMAEEKKNSAIVENGKEENSEPLPALPPVKDIEDVVSDTAVEKKRLEKTLDKIRYGLSSVFIVLIHPFK